MRTPRTALVSPVRLWFDCNETAVHAWMTIGLRSAMWAAAVWSGRSFPAGEAIRMIGEKQLAAMEALTALWLQLARPSGRVDHTRLAAEFLRPYRRRTRANARRLSRPR
jgi:hypothetical protein